ncbi:MAG: ABC transporter substrate-binding protein, partial [Bacteroidales bacterium]|nr:ABC transporter substrate-binding protein [Bacteroidales bacterium]
MKIKILYAQVIFLISILIFTTCDDLKEDFNIKSYKNPIKIAVVGDVTIGREVAENIFFAVKMADDEINSNGGLTINGVEREIELVFKNSGGTPGIGETVINELINENIDIIIGPTVSAVAVDMANLCIENNILMMTYSATVPELSYLNDRNLIWRTCPSDAFSGIVMADYAFDSLDIDKGAILYREDKFGLAMKEVIAEKFILSGGEILATASYPTEEVELNLYDYSNQINHLLKFEPQIIFTIVFELEVGKITQDFWASPLYQNYVLKPKIFLTEGGFP